MIELNITGLEKTIEKCLALESLTDRVMYEGMKRSLEQVRDLAKENLERQLYTETALEKMGYARNQHGWPQIPINEAWEILDGEMKFGEINGTLVNWSQHAAAVEFGTIGSFPIIPRQSKAFILGPEGPFLSIIKAGQAPKHFLTDAMNRGEAISERVYGPMLKREIATLLLK